MIKRHKLLACFAGLLLSHAASAGVIGKPLPSPMWRSVLSLSLGPAWSSQGSTQTLYLQTGIQKAYINQSPWSNFASGEIFFAGQREISNGIDIQVGFVAGASGDNEFRGDIWEDGNRIFDNYSYHYLAHQIRFAAKAKISKQMSSQFQIYAGGSAGIGLNRAHNYTSTPKIAQAVNLPAFSDNTQSSFSYSLELGVQKTLQKHWVFGVGYQMIDWGKLSLERAPGQTLGTGLQERHVYTHSAQFTLSYLA